MAQPGPNFGWTGLAHRVGPILPPLPILALIPHLLCRISLSLPLLPGLGFTRSIREVFTSPSAFPSPLRLATKLLIGKNLRLMVNPTKSWPKASDEWFPGCLPFLEDT